MQQHKPLVSVCIPTYNRMEYLPETLDSVFEQTFSNYEVVVVDDGSTDGTREYIQSLNQPVRYVYQENAGLSAARNRLVHEAQGTFISFLDSDDLLLPDALQQLAKAADGRTDVCVYGGRLRIDKTGRIIGADRETRPSGQITAALFERIIFYSSGHLIPKKAIRETGGFDESNQRCPDYIKFLELSVKYECIGIPQTTYKRRRHDGCMSKTNSALIRAECERLEEFYFKGGGKELVPEQLALKRLAKEAYRTAMAMVRESGDAATIRIFFKRSLKYRFTMKAWLRHIAFELINCF